MEAPPRRSTLAWVGLSLGVLAAAGMAACVAVARSMPRRAPTGGDHATGCALLAGWIAIGLTLLAGLACSIAGLLSARKSGRPPTLALIGLTLNAAPLPLAVLYDYLLTRGRL